MGTWSQPNTEEKAAKLERLMAKPLLKKDASDTLYHLTGDDDLFDFFEEFEEDADVRLLVRFHLERALDNLHLSYVTWDEAAIAICKRIIDA
ncbi:hypothetical protein O5O45_31765 [Hahella aquimaris]|uniref:hypothetical protein n=1 Tax=Hahella sp. HNIBRBA332 TaxID=3015983 RepID=UPI00273A951A|nr:hypothetical protein [Hahella sp. HNIBRBA332]WLQ14298.1 hypothetical protein O5O45_31765 [Hahella sp. HNIBRBA332]